MQKSEFIRARIEPDLKQKVEKIFSTLGLSVTEAITIFYKQVEMQKGLPFEIKIPNKETRKAIEETQAGEGLFECENIDDLFRKLEI